MQIVDVNIIQLKDKELMMKHIYILVALVFGETVLNFFLVYFSNFISQNVIRDIRERLYHKPVSYTHLDVYKRQNIMWIVMHFVGFIAALVTGKDVDFAPEFFLTVFLMFFLYLYGATFGFLMRGFYKTGVLILLIVLMNFVLSLSLIHI